MMQSSKSLKEQSKRAYGQWAAQWRENAKSHAHFKMKPLDNFASSGIGRAILLVANGFSFEENIETIKRHAKNVDILCCDKTLGHLLSHGIKPTFCFVADANVSYEKYLQPYEHMLGETILLMNVCGNPKWSHNGNWKDRYFFVFKDILHSEHEFMQLSGCPNVITAAMNVSNMMLVVVTQCTNEVQQNLFGYDKIILIGYDYAWKPDGNYYAFDKDAGGKFYYMRHINALSAQGNMIFSSNNLSNCAAYLADYIRIFKMPVVQCSPDSLLLPTDKPHDLEEQMKYRYQTSDRKTVHQLLLQKNHIAERMRKVDDDLKSIAKRHYFAHLATI